MSQGANAWFERETGKIEDKLAPQLVVAQSLLQKGADVTQHLKSWFEKEKEGMAGGFAAHMQKDVSCLVCFFSCSCVLPSLFSECACSCALLCSHNRRHHFCSLVLSGMALCLHVEGSQCLTVTEMFYTWNIIFFAVCYSLARWLSSSVFSCSQGDSSDPGERYRFRQVKWVNEQLLIDAVGLVEEGGWKGCSSEGGIEVWRKYLKQDRQFAGIRAGKAAQFACIKASGIIDAPIDKVFELFKDNDRAKEYNEYCKEVRDLVWLDDKTKVLSSSDLCSFSLSVCGGHQGKYICDPTFRCKLAPARDISVFLPSLSIEPTTKSHELSRVHVPVLIHGYKFSPLSPSQKKLPFVVTLMQLHDHLHFAGHIF